jgi:hypothetical protein
VRPTKAKSVRKAKKYKYESSKKEIKKR